jgi:hypothetical protein
MVRGSESKSAKIIPSNIPSILDEDWVKAPIVVGGTGGSGTRGVVDFFDKIGIYMVCFTFRSFNILSFYVLFCFLWVVVF